MFAFRGIVMGVAAAAVAAGPGLVVLTGPADAAPTARATAQARCERPILTSHQGARADGDGNTLPAYLGAVTRGAEGIEMDLRITSDGHFVMFHNATVNGATNGRGRVDHKTFAQLEKLRTTRSHNRIPSIGQTLDALRPFDTRLQIELKEPAHWSPHALPRLVRLIKAHQMSARVVLYSLDIPTVRRIHHSWPGIDDAWKSVFVTVHPARAAKFTDGVVVNARSLTKVKVKAIHAAGLTAYSARLNRQSAWRKAVAAGTDTVLTTTLTAYEQWCSRQPG
jgi:glycerophosphoryl diester phosphodiesterase